MSDSARHRQAQYTASRMIVSVGILGAVLSTASVLGIQQIAGLPAMLLALLGVVGGALVSLVIAGIQEVK